MSPRIAFLQHSATDVPGVLGERARTLGLHVCSYRADRGPADLPRPGSFDVLVVMGSVASVLDSEIPWLAPEHALVTSAVDAGIPVLGVCFGGQLLAQVLGGTVSRAIRREIGWYPIEADDPRTIPSGPWLVWHEDAFTAPPGAGALARTEVSLHAFVLGIHTALQFHPEVTAPIVEAWVDDARTGDRLTEHQAAAVLAGFDDHGSGPDEQARLLFDGFLRRAAVLPDTRTGGGSPGRT